MVMLSSWIIFMDIEGRCLGSSIQKLSPGKEKIQKKRENKGDSEELYNIQYTAYPVWETFTFLRSCANISSYTLAPSQSSINQPPEELLDQNLFN